MKRITDAQFIQHPKYSEYLEFFLDSIKRECQGCTAVGFRGARLALDVLQDAAVLNHRGTKIETIDINREELSLLNAQRVLLTGNESCIGQGYIDRDEAAFGRETSSEDMLPIARICDRLANL